MNGWPEWGVRQRTPAGRAIVWLCAPDANAAVRLAHRRVGHMGGWPTENWDDLEVFARDDYAEQADAADYTRASLAG